MSQRNVRFTIRYSNDEAKEVQEQAAKVNISVAEYIRIESLRTPNRYPEIKLLIGRLINEINHVGVNINQIVKRYNSGEYQEGDKMLLVAYLEEISDTLKEAVTKLGNK